MRERLAWAIAAMTAGAGCTAYIYKSDVVGPHGEHLIELACNTPDACLELARQTCGGDYDIVTTGDAVSGGGKAGVSSANMMLVQCKKETVLVPPPPSATTPLPSGVDAPAR